MHGVVRLTPLQNGDMKDSLRMIAKRERKLITKNMDGYLYVLMNHRIFMA